MLRNPRLFIAESSVLELHTTFDPFPQDFCFYTLCFSLTRVVLHSLLSFQAPALITIMLFHHLQFLISSQSQVHQVSKSQLLYPSWDFLLKFPIFPAQVAIPHLPSWPQFPCFSPISDLCPRLLFSGPLPQRSYTDELQPQYTWSPLGPFFPQVVLHSKSYVSTA